MTARASGQERGPGLRRRLVGGLGDVLTLGSGSRPLYRQPGVWALLAFGSLSGEWSTPSDEPPVIRLLGVLGFVLALMAILSVLDFFALRGRRR